ncbi:transmembrane protein 39A isoform X1 [Ischnura elegans]|uniref:transmembrane protein 39A isoform X1 n=2 Tax=Ischnura elegans TaxID=197161 RepID=UPI001ED884F3|nr:transmembrane protein 39A isoform X1 [Ischnura elegans]
MPEKDAWEDDMKRVAYVPGVAWLSALMLLVIAVRVAGFCGRPWSQAEMTSGATSNPVSRRRRLTRDPINLKRPPPLPPPSSASFSPVVRRRLNAATRDSLTSKKPSGTAQEEPVTMPGGRRNLGRSNPGRPPNFPSSDDSHKSKSTCQGTESASTGCRAISPKHIPIPNIPRDSDMIFEILMFAYTGIASFIQFLHLYRSVWWLPQSYNRYAMNFYLIDPYLVGFIMTILGRRVVYCILSRILVNFCPTPLWPAVQHLLKLFLLVVVLTSLIWCTYFVMLNHPLVYIFYLCYPISVYFILFGLNVSPFFDVTALPSPSSKEEVRGKIGAGEDWSPEHSCSMTPSVIRDEVEGLKIDFNNRMKQVLFSSVLNAYFAGFVPCCFAQNCLYYDVYWATQHLAFVWLGCFTMYVVHCYPLKYCDILHQSALHLGRWVRIEGRSHTHIPSHIWAEGTLWHQGALVKHMKELYKAEGLSNAAEPGNPAHARFYAVFYKPPTLMVCVLALQVSLVIGQAVALAHSSEWNHVMSIGLLLGANYLTLFRLTRDYLLSWRIYKAEKMMQEKTSG